MGSNPVEDDPDFSGNFGVLRKKRPLTNPVPSAIHIRIAMGNRKAPVMGATRFF